MYAFALFTYSLRYFASSSVAALIPGIAPMPLMVKEGSTFSSPSAEAVPAAEEFIATAIAVPRVSALSAFAGAVDLSLLQAVSPTARAATIDTTRSIARIFFFILSKTSVFFKLFSQSKQSTSAFYWDFLKIFYFFKNDIILIFLLNSYLY